MSFLVLQRASVVSLILALAVAGCSESESPASGAGGTSGGSGGRGGSATGGAGGAISSTGGNGGGGSGGTTGTGGASAGTGGAGGGAGMGGGSGGGQGDAAGVEARDGASTAETGGEAGSADGAGGSASCAPGGNGFDTAVNGVALDRKTCLAWERQDPQRDVSGCPLYIRDSNSKLCFSEATKYCTALRLDGGKSDWRLPTAMELQTIVVSGNSPALDTTVFPQAIKSIYWSSELKAGKVVGIDFSNAGMVNPNIGPDGPQGVRCVRGPVR